MGGGRRTRERMGRWDKEMVQLLSFMRDINKVTHTDNKHHTLKTADTAHGSVANTAQEPDLSR